MLKGILPFMLAAAFAGAVVGDSSTARAQDPVRTVAQALLDFEGAMKWEAVQDSWRGQRDAWMAGLRSASSAGQVASALAALETAMKWEAVQDSWRGRRPGWVQEVAAARSAQQVARLLLDLEQATLWEAMYDTWRGTRPGWVATLQGVTASGGSPATGGYVAGQAVEVLWNGTWYASSIVRVNGNGTYRIHYTGWADSWDEDVGPDRIRRP